MTEDLIPNGEERKRPPYITFEGNKLEEDENNIRIEIGKCTFEIEKKFVFDEEQLEKVDSANCRLTVFSNARVVQSIAIDYDRGQLAIADDMFSRDDSDPTAGEYDCCICTDCSTDCPQCLPAFTSESGSEDSTGKFRKESRDK